MKFTKQQLLDALKEKLTENGKHLSVSEKTMRSLSDSHYELLANEETELDELVGKVLSQYVSLNGNYEKDNADFIKKWKEEHPEKTGEGKVTEGESSEEMKKLLERIATLEEKNTLAENEKLVSAKRNELQAKFKEKGIKDGKWTQKYIEKLALTPETDIEKETADALDIYNLSRSKSGLVTPGTTGTEGDDEVNDKMWDGLRKALKINKSE
jgi:hypothetical protein